MALKTMRDSMAGHFYCQNGYLRGRKGPIPLPVVSLVLIYSIAQRGNELLHSIRRMRAFDIAGVGNLNQNTVE